MSRAGKDRGPGVSRLMVAYRRRPAWQRWLVAVAWMALIFAVSAQAALPEAPDPLLDILLKKLAHMLEYAILCLLLWGALPMDTPLWAWVLAVLYAISDEIHQTFVPGRNGWVVDVLVDGVGAGLAVLAIWRLRVSRDAKIRSRLP